MSYEHILIIFSRIQMEKNKHLEMYFISILILNNIIHYSDWGS